MGGRGVVGTAGSRFKGACLSLLVALAAMPAALADTIEQPLPWQMGMQPAASPVRQHIDALHDELLVIITLITLFVLGLLLYAIVRFNAKRNPVPSKTTHAPLIEVIWTVVPILILVSIAIPSFKLLYYMDKAANPAMTVKVTGHQWYWSYQYPDQGGLSFDSNILSDADDVKNGDPRLLGVDNPVVVPVNTVIRILVTSTDVIHSWFMPSMGVQEYAVPGRTNESWMSVNHVGRYFGQCNQICGVNHSFMPIEIEAVSKADFEKWVAAAKKKFARNDASGLRLAAATAH
ncbi:MAG TPA: cytochrome c oxidase subunit II [Stellaceae bacterium]|nr:cytochrome c oxidase subunit II [Stellaceae bacterium]